MSAPQLDQHQAEIYDGFGTRVKILMTIDDQDCQLVLRTPRRRCDFSQAINRHFSEAEHISNIFRIIKCQPRQA